MKNKKEIKIAQAYNACEEAVDLLGRCADLAMFFAARPSWASWAVNKIPAGKWSNRMVKAFAKANPEHFGLMLSRRARGLVAPRVSLYMADLAGADLAGANLEGADLYRANLADANLRGANLHWANLRWANLADADLCGADLRGADLAGATLRGANLEGANLHGAIK